MSLLTSNSEWLNAQIKERLEILDAYISMLKREGKWAKYKETLPKVQTFVWETEGLESSESLVRRLVLERAAGSGLKMTLFPGNGGFSLRALEPEPPRPLAA